MPQGIKLHIGVLKQHICEAAVRSKARHGDMASKADTEARDRTNGVASEKTLRLAVGNPDAAKTDQTSVEQSPLQLPGVFITGVSRFVRRQAHDSPKVEVVGESCDHLVQHAVGR